MSAIQRKSQLVGAIWSAWVVLALLTLPLLHGPAYSAAVAISGLVLAALPGMAPQKFRGADGWDVVAVVGLYMVVVALLRLAFIGFTTDNTLGLFLSFAAALFLGVMGPVVYTSWIRHRPLSSIGLQGGDLRKTLALAVLFGSVQCAITLWGYDFPAPVDWVPLLVMALVVGVFESIFFRGFIQNRLEEQFGSVAGIGGASVLYGLYHVGYGMESDGILFLTGLGIVYAVAFAIARSIYVLWPLLTPLGSFFSQLDSGGIELPWASILGFADVLALMVAAVWLARRHEARSARRSPNVEVLQH